MKLHELLFSNLGETLIKESTLMRIRIPDDTGRGIESDGFQTVAVGSYWAPQMRKYYNSYVIGFNISFANDIIAVRIAWDPEVNYDF